MCDCGSDPCGCPNPRIPEGPPGEGIPGPIGPTGPGATVAPGTVTSLPFGDAPTVTNTGTATDAVFAFGIPAGQDGTNGTPGADGDSAYTIAVDQGTFVGTVNQFALSLRLSTVLTANFVMPVAIGLVTITVQSTYQMVPGMWIYVETGGWLRVNTVFSFTSMSVQNTGATGNAAGGTTINSGSRVNSAGAPGPTGPAGPSGASLTPTFRSGTLAPSNGLGVDGDVYLQQVNPGRWQFWYKSSGVYTAFPTGVITANRLIGYSTVTSDPNSLGLSGMNSGDQYWTQIGITITQWVYNGSSWVVALQFTTGGGGGGTDTLTTVTANSAPGAYGQQSGPLNIQLQRTIYWEATNALHTVPGGTYQFNLAYPKTILQLAADVTLNHTTLGGDSEWTFEIYNADVVSHSLTYSAGVWKVIPGLAYPTSLSSGERVQLVCRKDNGKLCMTQVIANTSIIP